MTDEFIYLDKYIQIIYLYGPSNIWMGDTLHLRSKIGQCNNTSITVHALSFLWEIKLFQCIQLLDMTYVNTRKTNVVNNFDIDICNPSSFVYWELLCSVYLSERKRTWKQKYSFMFALYPFIFFTCNLFRLMWIGLNCLFSVNLLGNVNKSKVRILYELEFFYLYLASVFPQVFLNVWHATIATLVYISSPLRNDFFCNFTGFSIVKCRVDARSK